MTDTELSPCDLPPLPEMVRELPLLERLELMAVRFRRHAGRQNDGTDAGTQMWAWLKEAGALCEKAAKEITAERERSELIRGALRNLSNRLEQEIADAHGDALILWLPDHACAECVPNSTILVDGFRCCRHEGRALITSPERSA